MMTEFQVLQRVFDLVGSRAAVAEIANVTPQAVAQWTRVPTARVLLIERALDGAITRQEMRPDIYPD
jgi:DNA-binding transcriptional regulator YdaS (Cro superfamily)